MSAFVKCFDEFKSIVLAGCRRNSELPRIVSGSAAACRRLLLSPIPLELRASRFVLLAFPLDCDRRCCQQLPLFAKYAPKSVGLLGNCAYCRRRAELLLLLRIRTECPPARVKPLSAGNQRVEPGSFIQSWWRGRLGRGSPADSPSEAPHPYLLPPADPSPDPPADLLLAQSSGDGRRWQFVDVLCYQPPSSIAVPSST